MTRRRWIAEHWDESSATLVGPQAEHMARVLRAREGVKADVIAGGRVFHAEVASVTLAGDQSRVRFLLLAELEADPAMPVTLALAIYKFDAMEWAVEKATELGVAAIAPMIASRTDKHLGQASEKRVERWQRIAREAAKQARRSDVPLIHNPTPLPTLVSAPSLATRIVLAEQERTTMLSRALDKLTPRPDSGMPAVEIAIGPEGGWAPSEEALFDAHGWRAVSLGPRILRAETAAIAALAVVASYLER
jgi:16S rRNA (uracil1498-N3)-methyltransferase